MLNVCIFVLLCHDLAAFLRGYVHALAFGSLNQALLKPYHVEGKWQIRYKLKIMINSALGLKPEFKYHHLAAKLTCSNITIELWSAMRYALEFKTGQLKFEGL